MSEDLSQCSILKGILQNGSAFNYPAVRFGRVPKREKAKILAAMQSSRMKTQESKVLSEMTDEGKLIETIVRAHYDTCDYTRNKMEPFMLKAKQSPNYVTCTGTTCPMKGRPEESFLAQFSERFMDHVRQVCTFAKLIPGFKCLHHDDQVTLLKSCVFEVLLVRLSGLFDNQSLVCLNGDIIRKDSINAMPPGNAKFLMDSVFELAQRLNHFRLSDAEIGLFCGVVIITADRPGLRNPELVQKMQNKLKSVLQNILLPQHPEHGAILQELLTMIHDLRTLNTLHTEKFLQQCKVSGEVSPHEQSQLQRHLLYGRSWEQQLDRDSTGNGSPHSSDSLSHEERRSPMGSVSSSESICSNEVSKLTVHDLKINGSVLMNALTLSTQHHAAAAAAAAAAATAAARAASPQPPPRKRDLSEEPSTGAKYKVRKLDSPSDSGIDSPKAHQGSHSTNTSVCSSPRSTMEDKVKDIADDEADTPSAPKARTDPPLEEQHPLLKRALQQPPQPYIGGNQGQVTTFQDEVYKPHKKFRRGMPTDDGGCSSSTSEAPRPQSLLASTLSRAIPMAKAESKRNEILANLILEGNGRFCPASSSSRQQPGLLMCADSVSWRRHIPVPPPPTQAPPTGSAHRPSATPKSSSEVQPLNLSTRTPPPASHAQQTPSQHDIPTEA